MTSDFEARALRAADDLLDSYPNVTDTPNGLRHLLALAWALGSKTGSEETANIMRDELAKLAGMIL